MTRRKTALRIRGDQLILFEEFQYVEELGVAGIKGLNDNKKVGDGIYPVLEVLYTDLLFWIKRGIQRYNLLKMLRASPCASHFKANAGLFRIWQNGIKASKNTHGSCWIHLALLVLLIWEAHDISSSSFSESINSTVTTPATRGARRASTAHVPLPSGDPRRKRMRSIPIKEQKADRAKPICKHETS